MNYSELTSPSIPIKTTFPTDSTMFTPNSISPAQINISKLSTTATNVSTTTITNTLSNAHHKECISQFGCYLSDINSPVFIPAGIWDLNLYITTNVQLILRYHIYLYDSSTQTFSTKVETITGEATITSSTITQTVLSNVIENTVYTSGYDMLWIFVTAQSSDNNHSLSLYYEGTSYCHIHTTLSATQGPTGPTGPSISSVVYGTTSTYTLADGTDGQHLTIINNSTGATGFYVSGSFIDSNDGATGSTMRAPLQYNTMSMIYSTTFSKWLVMYRSSGVSGPF
jgi:hypothetical protein